MDDLEKKLSQLSSIKNTASQLVSETRGAIEKALRSIEDRKTRLTLTEEALKEAEEKNNACIKTSGKGDPTLEGMISNFRQIKLNLNEEIAAFERLHTTFTDALKRAEETLKEFTKKHASNLS